VQIVLTAVVLALAFVVVSFLLPKKSTTRIFVETSVKMDRAFSVVSDLRTWPDWTYWSKASDPHFDPIFEAKDGSGTTRMKWNKFHGRGGCLEFHQVVINSLISYAVDVDGMPISLSGDISFHEINDGKIKIIWTAYADAGSKIYLRFLTMLIAFAMKDQLKQNFKGLEKYFQES
jgi:hypothetical protein